MGIFLLLLLSLASGVLGYFGLQFLGRVIVNNYLKTSGYMEREEQGSADSLQRFVSNYSVSAEDDAMLDTWVEQQEVVYISVFRNNLLLYDSAYSANDQNDEDNPAYYGSAHLYSIQFSDGPANVYVIGFYDYHYIVYVTVISICLAAVLAILLFLLLIQKKINYIKQLEREVKVLETGGLCHAVTVKGKDELASLAIGLNEMRSTLDNNFKMVQELSQANTDLVTELSHDLRTPLTALLLYLELLEKKKYKDEASMMQYLNKASEKAREVKTMSDDLFERFLITGDKDVKLESPCKPKYVFEDSLSDVIIFLESQGFQTASEIEWSSSKISVSSDYINRIMNNINSNILKYADKASPVIIRTRAEAGAFNLHFENRKKADAGDIESTNVGLPNIRMMMEKMNGGSRILDSGDSFAIELSFPLETGSSDEQGASA